MDHAVLKRLREVAKAQRATLCEALALAPSPSGDLALIEATDKAGRAAILIPSTQLPQLAAQLLQLWTQCRGDGRDSALHVNAAEQGAVMEQCAVPATGATVHAQRAGYVTIAVDISGIPLFVELPLSAAQQLGARLVVGQQGQAVGDAERH